MELRNQKITTAILSTLGLNMGLIFSWPIANIMLFASENTILNRPLTETEISLLGGSLSSFGALLSTLIAGSLLDRLGRKRCAVLASLNLILVWSILSLCKRVEVVLTCMFISGMSGCVPIITCVYISEICHESIRGSMVGCLSVSCTIGGLLAVFFGGYVLYEKLLYIGLMMTIGSTIALLMIKDTPVYLLQIGNIKEAEEAFAFYKHNLHNVDDVKVITEKINHSKRTFKSDIEDSMLEIHKLNPIEEPAEKFSFWQFMKRSKSSRQALFVNSILILASTFQGLTVIQIYIQPFVALTVPTLSPVVCSIILAVITVIAGVLAAYLTDAAGRRPLMIYGSIGSGLCCVILGTQMQFYWGPTWIILVFVYTFTVMVTIGASTVPMVLLSELYLPEVRSILSMVALELTWISKFIVLCIFSPTNISFIGWGVVFYIFSVLCFLTSVFTYFYLPETMGLTVDEIQPLFLKRRLGR